MGSEDRMPTGDDTRDATRPTHDSIKDIARPDALGSFRPTHDSIQGIARPDPTNSVALLNTLPRRLSLIQGPPNTSKSCTGEKMAQVLLANKAKAKLEPILCVCYTIHALSMRL
ncbi:hypothetical protein B0T18DRAFT_121622 [Schizothecium vesticola]|uniref:Uncharacterized protein n=1 Tax=Schizothecium vesticola TaxID=314040 RepID=A0AA40F2L0_9PEZI|nr:hypothetical protein B0T18DRAFT_121622 [Schizothecium vesticola]